MDLERRNRERNSKTRYGQGTPKSVGVKRREHRRSIDRVQLIEMRRPGIKYPSSNGAIYTGRVTKWPFICIRARVIPRSLRAAPFSRSYYDLQPWMRSIPNDRNVERMPSPC